MRSSLVWKYQIFLLIAVLSFIFLAHSWGRIPALGPLLSPFQGIWRNLPEKRPESETLAVRGLKENVEVVWDNYGVPHIFSKHPEDLYRAQGYLVARDRLFQMDLSSRPGAGTVSEFAGEVTRDLDRFFIKLGMRKSSEKALQMMMSNPRTKLALENYTEGVNAYIESLTPHTYPPEYKVLGVEPARWTPLRTAHFLKTMAFNLAARSFDLYLTQHLQKFGWQATEFLFPNNLATEDYIFDQRGFKFDDKPLPVPLELEKFVSPLKELPDYFQPNKNQGSNNFAVSAAKSTTGFPILANDTHLGLSLPSVWYELQLNDETHNVYGATFPGSPGVILGFNSELAWGVTNGTTDVVDWFEIEFRSEDSIEYLVDGNWRKAEKQIELLKVKGGGTEEVEVLWTEFGVIMHREGKLGWALRWTAHEASNELLAFLELNHAQSYDKCIAAIAHFKTPSQNFICVDKAHIGIKHQGEFPARFNNQGKYVMDGRKSENNWSGWIPQDDLPSIKDPSVGYVRSSNNMVMNSTYPYYLGWDYDESYRALRIRHLLESKQQLSPMDLMSIQNDIKDLHAEAVIPPMITYLSLDELTEEQVRFVEQLRAWDFLATTDSVATSFYKIWWNKFEELLFDEFGPERFETYYPRRQKTAEIFNEPLSQEWEAWLDLKESDEKEDLKALVNQSFKQTWDALSEEYGSMIPNWQWGHARPTDFRHVARLPGFGQTDLKVPGTRYTPRASTGDLGPTWKLIVSLGPELKAWTNIPGHNKGHPFSQDFEFYVSDWIEGKMKLVHFLASSKEGEKFKYRSRLTSQPKTLNEEQ